LVRGRDHWARYPDAQSVAIHQSVQWSTEPN
jgi:hypothetical protein